MHWLGKLTTAVTLSLVIEASASEPTQPGGAFTTKRWDTNAFVQAGPGLSPSVMKRFELGRKLFDIRWVVFPSLAGEWGLGPTFIAERCSDCHVRAGRGKPPTARDAPLLQTLVKISVPGTGPHGGPKPHPNYGGQLQNRGLTGEDPRAHGYGDRVQPEADLYLDWSERSFQFPDGEVVGLREPSVRVENLRFGPLGEDTARSLRNTPAVFGLGLLEAVPEAAIIALAETQQRQGLDGRPNRVWDMQTKTHRLGRFGWKANVPTIRQQLAAAFIGDIGVTSSLFPKENCPGAQTDCAAQPPGNNPEVIDSNLTNLEIWTAALAVPARRSPNAPSVRRGEQLFQNAGCGGCHVPTLNTGPHAAVPQLSGQTIHPYTDLLLHDMGPALSDGRSDFQAGPQDWRTPPLWGLGLSAKVSGELALLHDGRARSVTEAILWHGGASENAKNAFVSLSRDEREALVAFINSL